MLVAACGRTGYDLVAQDVGLGDGGVDPGQLETPTAMLADMVWPRNLDGIVLSDGTLLIAWAWPSGNLEAAIVELDGTVVAGPQTLVPIGALDLQLNDPMVAELDGRIGMVFSRQDYSGTGIFFQEIDTELGVVGSEVQVNTTNIPGGSTGSFVSSNGGWLVSYFHSSQYFYRRLAASGQPADVERTVVSGAGAPRGQLFDTGTAYASIWSQGYVGSNNLHITPDVDAFSDVPLTSSGTLASYFSTFAEGGFSVVFGDSAGTDVLHFARVSTSGSISTELVVEGSASGRDPHLVWDGHYNVLAWADGDNVEVARFDHDGNLVAGTRKTIVTQGWPGSPHLECSGGACMVYFEIEDGGIGGPYVGYVAGPL